MITFTPSRRFRRQYDRLFQKDPAAANVMLLLAELANDRGEIRFDNPDPAGEIQRLMLSRFEDPRSIPATKGAEAMNRGYIRLWRKSLDAGWIKNHKLWAFWTWALLKATHCEYDAIVGLQVVHLIPGQFIFGLHVASRETGLTLREIRTILEFLKKAGNLTIKTTNKFSVITIINWPTYQGEESENDKQRANKGQHTNTITHKPFLSDSIEIRLSELLLEKILSRNPNHKKPNIQTWAKDVDRMIRLDKRTPEDIRAVVEWCQDDLFWQNNILSTSKLREKFDLCMKMGTEGKSDSGKPWFPGGGRE